MPIRFIPNDPLAADVPPREQPPRANPPAGRPGFAYTGAVAEGVYPIGSPEFLFWQCREAALAALEAWATVAPPLAEWQGDRRQLPLRPNAGQGLDAHYDRSAVSFLEWTTAGKTTWLGASTDAVAHEVGHALLDALRPELWDSAYTEGAAFHEAFADCMALLVGLGDGAIRSAILAGEPQLRKPNFLEAIAENAADAIRRHDGPQHPQSLPRRALNALQWEMPINLPPLGAPALLTSEPHSFSRIFTGCFYDTICNVFAAQADQGEQGLLRAAQTTGRLLVTAANDAPEGARFFQAVGRAMILADETSNGAANRDAIRNAFAGHNVALGAAAMLSPTSGLVGAEPRVSGDGTKALLGVDTRRHLLRRLRAPRGATLRLGVARLGGRAVAKAVHVRHVPLGMIDRALRGVVVPAVESVLVGSSVARAVVLGHVPDPTVTLDEVHHFVRGLVERQAVHHHGSGGRNEKHPHARTHAIRTRRGKRLLMRARFTCAP